jgi:iron complex outermembrane receptor protein
MKVKQVFQKIHYRSLLFLIAGFLMSQNVLAQEVNASGVVKDAAGEPMMGVVVSAPGTEFGTVTGMDGDFSLSVPQGTVLEFQQMSYTTQSLPAAANMVVTLSDDVQTTQIVTVVGIGYGTARKEDLTGAISSVSQDNMKQGVITSSEQMLQGKIAGLSVVQGSGDPTAGALLRLRGTTSLSGKNDPLIVVDGVPDVPLNTIPSADILSMDVLKDASAAAIYGSRGANGVILVTTKNKNQERISANYSGYVSLSQAANKLDLLDRNEWIDAGGIDRGGNTDWQDALMRTALTQSHALTFSNISQKGGFKGSISYLDAEGVVNTSELERLSGSLSGWTNLLNDRVTVEMGLSKTRDNYRDMNGAAEDLNQRRLFASIYQANPTWNIFAEDGQTLYKDPAQNRTLFNPLNFVDKFLDDRTRDRFMGYAKADVWFLKTAENEGLKGTINLSTNSDDTQERRYFYTDEQRQIAFTPVDGTRGRADRVVGYFTQKQLEMYLNYDKVWNDKHKLNLMGGYSYSQTNSEGFGLGTRGYDNDWLLYNNLGASKNIIENEGIIDEQGYYRDLFTSGAFYSYAYKDESKLTSFFGRVNYTYMSKYMLTATLRADGSSKFGTNNKWGYFPSASLAWRITEESFMQSTKSWLSDLKLRVGYGLTGNQGGIAAYTSIAAREPEPGHQLDGTVTDDPTKIPIIKTKPARNANPDLKWETTAQLNAGLDFSLFKNRLSGTVDVYQKTTQDLLYYQRVQGTGEAYFAPYTLKNIGEMKNQGIEVSLNGTIIKKEHFNWAANMVLAHNKNEFTGFNQAVELLNMGVIYTADRTVYNGKHLSADSYTQYLRPGYSVGSFFGAKTDGLDENGNIIYLHADGSRAATYDDLTMEEKDQYLGCAMPKLTIGFGMNFDYRGFDLGVSTNTMLGQKVFNATSMILSTPADEALISSDPSESGLLLNQLESSLGLYSNREGRAISDHWLEDASFFRIQNITLGYTFDLKEKTKNALSSLRLYATVENPFVFTGYSGVDPEVSIDMNLTEKEEWKKKSPGIDNFDNYPKPRTYLFGVNIQF